MASKTETGHVTNIYLAKEIVSICEGYGVDYQPTNPLIAIAHMSSLIENAETLHRKYSEGHSKFKIAANEKTEMVKTLKRLAKNSVHFYQSLSDTEQNVEVAKSVLRKITGSNVRKKRDKNHEVIAGQVSNCQMDFPHLLANFDYLLVYFRSKEEIYTPMETDIQLDQMEAFLETITALGDTVTDLKAKSIYSRIDRDMCMYQEGVGLVDVTLLCKKYVCSVFGTRSEKARMVTKLRLRRMMKLKGEGE